MSQETVQRISQQQLESYLWGAATLLRGTIDAGDYKQFIFPLLFYKRLCDVYDEERTKAIEQVGQDFPESHRLQIPEDAHWGKTREVTSNVGQAIQSAMRAIEKANQDKLYGIFGDAQWTNKDRLSDAMLRDLIEHFSSLDLTIANLPEDELGNGYEYLIKKFADDSGHTAAEFYTNRTVVHLMTELLQPQPGESIYDPTCGSGGMLLSAITHLKNQGKEWRNVKLYGQELNLMTSSIARMNCFLHGVEDFRIERGNTLSTPKFIEGGELHKFDVILANPPYSIKQWDRAAFENDVWGRNEYGTPPQSCADYAFQQHINKSLKSKSGRCAILWPHGVLFRRGEREIRRKMIEDDLIECVIGLGKNLFYNSAMEACILICRTDKPPERRRKVLLIDALDEVTHERGQSFLTAEHIHRIAGVYHEFTEEARFSKVITNTEALGNDGSLAIPLYIESGDGPRTAEETLLELGESLAEWSDASEQLREALSEFLPEVDLPQLEFGDVREPEWLDRSTWKRVKLGDVVVRTAKKVDLDTDDVQRWVGADHMDEGDTHIRRWSTTDDPLFPPTFRYTFQAGTVMLHSRNPKKVCMPGFDGITGEKIFVLEPQDEVLLHPRYLLWLLASPRFQAFVETRVAGSVNKFLNWSALAGCPIDLPPLTVQSRILALLDQVDALAENLGRVAAAVRTCSDAYAMTTLAPTSESDTVRFEDLTEKLTVGIVVKPAAFYTSEEDGIPTLRSLNVLPSSFALSDLVRISPEGHAKHAKSQLREGDVVVVRTGRPGDAAVVSPDVAGMNAIDLIIARPQPGIHADYLAEFLNSAFGRRLARKGTAGTAQKHLNVKEIRTIPITMVNHDTQVAIADQLRRWRITEGLLKDLNDQLNAVRNHMAEVCA